MLRITCLRKAISVRACAARLCESPRVGAKLYRAAAVLTPPATQFFATPRAACDTGLSSPAYIACYFREPLKKIVRNFPVQKRTASRRNRNHYLKNIFNIEEN